MDFTIVRLNDTWGLIIEPICHMTSWLHASIAVNNFFLIALKNVSQLRVHYFPTKTLGTSYSSSTAESSAPVKICNLVSKNYSRWNFVWTRSLWCRHVNWFLKNGERVSKQRVGFFICVTHGHIARGRFDIDSYLSFIQLFLNGHS